MRPASGSAVRSRPSSASELGTALEGHGLQQYARPLATMGFTTVSSLVRLSSRRVECEKVIDSLNFLPGHRVRFMNAIEELRARRRIDEAARLVLPPQPTDRPAGLATRATQIASAYGKSVAKPRPSSGPARARTGSGGTALGTVARTKVAPTPRAAPPRRSHASGAAVAHPRLSAHAMPGPAEATAGFASSTASLEELEAALAASEAEALAFLRRSWHEDRAAGVLGLLTGVAAPEAFNSRGSDGLGGWEQAFLDGGMSGDGTAEWEHDEVSFAPTPTDDPQLPGVAPGGSALGGGWFGGGGFGGGGSLAAFQAAEGALAYTRLHQHALEPLDEVDEDELGFTASNGKLHRILGSVGCEGDLGDGTLGDGTLGDGTLGDGTLGDGTVGDETHCETQEACAGAGERCARAGRGGSSAGERRAGQPSEPALGMVAPTAVDSALAPRDAHMAAAGMAGGHVASPVPASSVLASPAQPAHATSPAPAGNSQGAAVRASPALPVEVGSEGEGDEEEAGQAEEEELAEEPEVLLAMAGTQARSSPLAALAPAAAQQNSGRQRCAAEVAGAPSPVCGAPAPLEGSAEKCCGAGAGLGSTAGTEGGHYAESSFFSDTSGSDDEGEGSAEAGGHGAGAGAPQGESAGGGEHGGGEGGGGGGPTSPHAGASSPTPRRRSTGSAQPGRRSAASCGLLAHSFDGSRPPVALFPPSESSEVSGNFLGSLGAPDPSETFRCVSFVLHKHICTAGRHLLVPQPVSAAAQAQAEAEERRAMAAGGSAKGGATPQPSSLSSSSSSSPQPSPSPTLHAHASACASSGRVSGDAGAAGGGDIGEGVDDAASLARQAVAAREEAEALERALRSAGVPVGAAGGAEGSGDDEAEYYELDEGVDEQSGAGGDGSHLSPAVPAARSPGLSAGARISLEASMAALGGWGNGYEPLLSPVGEKEHRGEDTTSPGRLAQSGLWAGVFAGRPEEPPALFDEQTHPLGASARERFDEPSLSEVMAFVRNVSRSARIGAEANIVALAYIERLLSRSAVVLGARTWRRVVLGAWLLAGKMWDDDSIDNSAFARMFLMFEKDINELEAAFLSAVDFDLSVPPSLYARYYFLLRAVFQEDSGTFALRPLDERIAGRCAASERARKELWGQLSGKALSKSLVLP